VKRAPGSTRSKVVQGVILWLLAILAFQRLGGWGWAVSILVATAFLSACLGLGLALLRWKTEE